MTKFIILISSGLLFLSACKKEFTVPANLANINVLYAVANMPMAIVNTSGKPGIWNGLSISNTNRVSYGASLNNAIIAKTGAYFSIAVLPDTLTPFYSNPKLDLQAGDVYTLFLSGTAGAVQPLLVKEQLVRRADSTTGIRFINLVSNGNPVRINIKNKVTPEVSGLAYNKVTEFTVYDAHNANSSYVFEVRDEVTGLLLTTYTYTVARTYNVTLAVRGLSGGTGANVITISRVNHY